MHRPSVVSAVGLLAGLFFGVMCGAQEAVSPATAAGTSAGNSKVRIVRLSEVKGQVQLDRLTGKGYESAMANLPVIEGAKLKTENGVAEVEFEDNSTLRLAPDSVVEFSRLELMPGGVKASTVNVEQGTVYVSLIKAKGNEFNVKFGQQSVNLPPDSHVRLQVTPSEANLAVMHGDVAVEDPAGTTAVGKNKTATFAMASQSQPVITKSLTDQPLDQWDSNAVQYHKSFANASAYGNAPYAYGVSDMNYYGSFINGCGGSFWRPYFASAAWDPYGSGAWAYYANTGYSWVSPYPWGWTPYHFGSWSFCSGVGWGWTPGGAWLGLANYYPTSNPGLLNSAGVNRPRPPINGPANARSTLVPVNMKAVPASSLTGTDKFVFRNDSAGIGVPRGSLGKLSSFSNHVSQHGTASTEVYNPASAPRPGISAANSTYPGMSPASSRGFDRSQATSHMQGPIGMGGGAHSSMQSAAPSGGPAGGGGGHR